MGRFLTVVSAFVVLVVGYLVTPGGMPTVLRVIIAIALALFAAKAVLTFFNRRSLAAALPEKLAILNSAKMVEFSWRATTFQFANNDFAQQFSSLNKSRQMENTNGRE